MWQNRIIKHGTESPESLLANPANWRIHPFEQQQSLTGILEEVGYVQSVIVNMRTSEEWGESQNIETMVDGHMRVETALSAGQEEIPVTYVDLSPAEEAKILATFDPISALAATDGQQLASLLDDVSTGNAYVEQLLEDLRDDANSKHDPSKSVQEVETLLDQAIQLKPPREYVVVMCADDDGSEFEELKSLLELGPVRKGGYKQGSPFDATGTQRVIKASDIIGRLRG